MENNIVLLGDSIFDNATYVWPTRKPLIVYLNEYLYKKSKATLVAQDGAKIVNVYHQIESIPEDTTRIFLSIGGNNLRHYLSFLDENASSVLKVLGSLYDMKIEFETEYSRLLEHLKGIDIPLTVCTIYNCSFEEEERKKAVETALAVFNDAKIRSAYRLSVPYIEMRDVCTESSDYVSNIEPSDRGGGGRLLG